MVNLTIERIDNDSVNYGKCYTEISDEMTFDSLIDAIRWASNERGQIDYEINRWVEKDAEGLIEDGEEIECVLDCCDAPDDCTCGAEHANDCTCIATDKEGKSIRLGDADIQDLPSNLAEQVYETANETAWFWMNEMLQDQGDDPSDEICENGSGISADYEWRYIGDGIEELTIVEDGGDKDVSALKIKICDCTVLCIENGFIDEGNATFIEADYLPLVTPYGAINNEYDIECLTEWAITGMNMLCISRDGALVLLVGDGGEDYKEEVARLDYGKWMVEGFKGINNPNVDFLVTVASAFSASSGGIVPPKAILNAIQSLFDGLDLMDDETQRRIENGASFLYNDAKVAAENLNYLWCYASDYSANCSNFYLERFVENAKEAPDFVPAMGYVMDNIVSNMKQHPFETKSAMQEIAKLDKAKSRLFLCSVVHEHCMSTAGEKVNPIAFSMLAFNAMRSCCDYRLAAQVMPEIIGGIMLQSNALDIDDEKLNLTEAEDLGHLAKVFARINKNGLTMCMDALTLAEGSITACVVTARDYVLLTKFCADAMIRKGMNQELLAYSGLWSGFSTEINENQWLGLRANSKWMAKDIAVIQTCFATACAVAGNQVNVYNLINTGNQLNKIGSVDLYDQVEYPMIKNIDNQACLKILAYMSRGALDTNAGHLLNHLPIERLDQDCIDAIPASCLLPLIRKIKNISDKPTEPEQVSHLRKMLAIRAVRMTETDLTPSSEKMSANQSSVIG